MLKNSQPLIALYVRNRTIFFLLRKSFYILRSKGLRYWRKSYLTTKTPKVLYKINDVPLIDLRLKGLSLMTPLKKLKDSARTIGIFPSFILLVKHKNSLSMLNYQAWIKKNENNHRPLVLSKINRPQKTIKITFIVYGNTKNMKKMSSTIESIINQSYQNTFYETSPFSRSLDKNSLLAFIESGDKLSKDAAFEIAQAHLANPQAKIIYGDEDTLYKNIRIDPFFKPDWSPELLRNYNYLGSLIVFTLPLSTKRLKTLTNDRALYELLKKNFIGLKRAEVLHIPKIISHRIRKSNNTLAAVKLHPCMLPTDKQPPVSIIIPFCDKVELLENCMQSIQQKTHYQNYKIILVNNNSQEPQTYAFLEEISTDPKIKLLNYDEVFNYSAINNFATQHAATELILFLNNDTEIIAPLWLDEMVATIKDKAVGAVGARLLYPDDRVQHAGVIIGLGQAAGHPFRFIKARDSGYFGLAKTSRNMSAVTGACLLTKKSLFKKLGGFDEKNLAITYNDVDYCLKVVSSGLDVIYNPRAELYHHESASRGKEESQAANHNSPEVVRYKKELKYFCNKWKDYIVKDPYYNPNLSKQNESYNIAL